MILTLEQIKQRVREYTYRPGWQINVYEGSTEGHHIEIKATVEDSTKPGNPVPLEIYSALPQFYDISHLDLWVSNRLRRIEIHESLEWFRIKGELFIDPHAENSDRDRY